MRQRSFCYFRPKGNGARGQQVVYWVTGTLRVEDNWALLLASHLSRLLSVPLVAICFLPRAAYTLAVAESARKGHSGVRGGKERSERAMLARGVVVLAVVVCVCLGHPCGTAVRIVLRWTVLSASWLHACLLACHAARVVACLLAC